MKQPKQPQCAADYYNFGVPLSSDTKGELAARKALGIDMVSVRQAARKLRGTKPR